MIYRVFNAEDKAAVRKNMTMFFLIVMSLAFYAFYGWVKLLYLLISIAVNFGLLRVQKSTASKKVMAAGVIWNIGMLAAFKYGLLAPYPTGLSFFSFALTALQVEAYKGTVSIPDLKELMLYTAFFPKMSQGPIVSPDNFLKQIREHDDRFSFDNFVIGMQMFAIGLFKKVIIADYMSTAVDIAFKNYRNCTMADVVIAMLCYTFQIYFDFSGYCDMASGIAKMVNFDLPINFDSPYKAISVTQFWKGWHISLTDFFRKYVYFPLGGSRKGKVRAYVNILIVFLVSGIWHGTGWTFIIWGLMHGCMQVLERLLGGVLDKIPKVIRWIYTFAFVNVAWLMFRAETFDQWRWMMGMVKEGQLLINIELAQALRIPGLRAALSILHIPYTDQSVYLLSAVIILGALLVWCLVPQNAQRREYKATKGSLVATAGILLVCMICMGSVSGFIYSNF